MQRRISQSVIVVEKATPASFPKPTEAIYIKPTKGSITLSMHRMFNLLLARAHEEGSEKESYRVAVSKLGSDLGTDSKNVEFLKDTARKLTSTVVEWDVITKQGKRKWGVSSMLASAELEEGGILEYSFSKHIKEKLLRPDVYARLNLRLQNKFRSRHGLALYEQCVRYIDNPSLLTTQLPWGEWAAMLSPSAGDSDYSRQWKYFSRDLLMPAIDEVNSIAENFTVEALISKEGRRVSTLQFRLKRKQQRSLDLETQPHLFNPELRNRMEKLGMATAKVRFAFSEFEESSIRAALEYTERRLKTNSAIPIVNPGAYFLDALKKRYGEPDTDELPGEQAGEGRAVSPEAQLTDLKGAFVSDRARLAERMFDEQSKLEQERAFAAYVETLGSSTLKGRFMKFGPKGKTTKMSFFVWLAHHTWGDPSDQDLLNFAARVSR